MLRRGWSRSGLESWRGIQQRPAALSASRLEDEVLEHSGLEVFGQATPKPSQLPQGHRILPLTLCHHSHSSQTMRWTCDLPGSAPPPPRNHWGQRRLGQKPAAAPEPNKPKLQGQLTKDLRVSHLRRHSTCQRRMHQAKQASARPMLQQAFQGLRLQNSMLYSTFLT